MICNYTFVAILHNSSGITHLSACFFHLALQLWEKLYELHFLLLCTENILNPINQFNCCHPSSLFLIFPCSPPPESFYFSFINFLEPLVIILFERFHYSCLCQNCFDATNLNVIMLNPCLAMFCTPMFYLFFYLFCFTQAFPYSVTPILDSISILEDIFSI
jgi:hypothetical protein